MWDIYVQFDWWDASAWHDIRGKWLVPPSTFASGFFEVAVPDAVGTHTVRERVSANETGTVYPTTSNFTQTVDVVSPNSASGIGVIVGVGLGAIAVGGVVAVVVLIVQGRRIRSPPVR